MIVQRCSGASSNMVHFCPGSDRGGSSWEKLLNSAISYKMIFCKPRFNAVS